MKKFAIAVSLLFLLTAGVAYLWVEMLKDDYKQELKRNADLKRDLGKSLDIATRAVAIADSIAKSNRFLYSQRQLTAIMNFKDSVLSGFPFHVGDVALIKPDSSRVVVEDVSVGGGHYNYYVNCLIRKKDGSRETVYPEDLIKLR